MNSKGSTKHETIGNYLGGLFAVFLLTVLCVVGIAPNQANGALRAVAQSSGGVVSGGAATLNPLTLGNVPSPDILYVGPTGVVTGSANLTYTDTSPLLTVGSGTTTSAGVQMGYSGTSGISGLWATGVTPTQGNSFLLVNNAGFVALASTASGSQVYLRPNGNASNGKAVIADSSGAFHPQSDADVTLGASGTRFSSAFLGSGGLSEQGTNVATAGATTINQATGSVTVASAASSVVVTNSTVVATDNIMATSQQNDTTCLVKNVVPGSGTFTINMTAACTANNRVGFFVVHLTN